MASIGNANNIKAHGRDAQPELEHTKSNNYLYCPTSVRHISLGSRAPRHTRYVFVPAVLSKEAQQTQVARCRRRTFQPT